MNSVYVPNTLSTGVHFVFLYCQLCLNKRVYNLVRRGRGGRPSRCHRAVAPWEAANAAVPCVARRHKPYGTVAGLFGAAEDSGDGEIFPEAEIRSGASMKGGSLRPKCHPLGAVEFLCGHSRVETLRESNDQLHMEPEDKMKTSSLIDRSPKALHVLCATRATQAGMDGSGATKHVIRFPFSHRSVSLLFRPPLQVQTKPVMPPCVTKVRGGAIPTTNVAFCFPVFPPRKRDERTEHNAVRCWMCH
jgi:hypothetical protein